MTGPRHSRRRALAALCAGASLWAMAGTALALPAGGSVVGETPGGTTVITPGAGTLTIDQGGQNVVIDWRSFDIGAGETVTFNQGGPNWIAFNRVDSLGPTTISGTLTASGGVWIMAPNGLLITGGAAINVGSFVGTTSSSNDVADMLDGGVITLDQWNTTATTTPSVIVQNGASISAKSGFVALGAERISQGGVITAGDSVFYNVNPGMSLEVDASSPNGQRLVGKDGFAIADRGDSNFVHSGDTTAGSSIWIKARQGDLRPGLNGLVNLSGTLEAGGINAIDATTFEIYVADNGNNGTITTVDTTGALISTLAGDVLIHSDSDAGGAVELGEIRSADGVTVSAGSGLTLSAQVQAAGDADIDALDSDLAINADIVAADIRVAGRDVTAADVTVQATTGSIAVQASRHALLDPFSTLLAGGAADDLLGQVAVQAGLASGGGNVELGRVYGRTVNVITFGAPSGTTGHITLAGEVVGTDHVVVFANGSNSQNQSAGVDVLDDVTSDGLIDIENLGVGEFVIASDADITAGGNLFLYSRTNLSIGADARLGGATGVLVQADQRLSLAAGATISLTGTPDGAQNDLIVLPPRDAYSGQYGIDATDGKLVLSAADFDLQGQVVSGDASAPGDIMLILLGNGPARIGGVDGVVSNAEFQHLAGRDIFVLAGHGEGGGGTFDLTVGDLTLDPARLRTLWLGTGSDHTLTIAGALVPTTPGGVGVQVGFVREHSEFVGTVLPDVLDGFIPGRVVVTGSLGSAANPLAFVNLRARNDILLGSGGFVAAAAADPLFDAKARSEDFTDIAPDHVFIAAEKLSFAALGRVLQQNTSTSGGFAGLLIGQPAADHPLLDLAKVGAPLVGGPNGWAASYQAGPTRVELFGLLTGAGAPEPEDTAQAPFLVSSGIDPQPPAGQTRLWQFNACDFGAARCGGPVAIVDRFEPPPPVDLADAGFGDGFRLSLDLPLTEEAEDEEEERYADQPIAGSGNVDLWTGPGQDIRP
jgi:filamentous hemagglutinin family protein